MNARKRHALGALLSFVFLAAASSDGKDARETVVERALSHVGSRYKTGGTAPPAFDCSGFVGFVLKPFVKALPRLSRDMASFGRPVTRDSLGVGDLVFFATTGDANAISHVALYIGEGKIVHAISDGPERGVTVTPLEARYWKTRYRSARRVLAASPAAAPSPTGTPTPAPAPTSAGTKPDKAASLDAGTSDAKAADLKSDGAKAVAAPSPWDTWDGIVRGDYEQWKERQNNDFTKHKNAYDADREQAAFDDWKKEHER